MKSFTLRTIASLGRNTDRGESRSQETRKLALSSSRSARGSSRRSCLALAPVLACALLGLAGLSAGAQDADKKDDAAQPAAAAAAAPAAPAPGTVTYTGLVDWYYGVNVRAPHGLNGRPFATLTTPSGEHIGIDNVGRSFDINSNEPAFSLGELNITRTPGKGFPLGITATLTFGDTAKLVHANEPGGTSGWQTIQQLYLTYTPHFLSRDWTIDGGIFVTAFGQEVIESSSNDNYSRGLLFQYAIPLYHAGVRVTTPISPTLTAMGMVVNGWNDIADDNTGKSVHLQLAWKPNAKFSGIVNWMGGPEGTGAYGSGILNGQGNLTTNLFELLPTYQVNDKLKVYGEFDYGNAAGDVQGIHASDNWLGYAAYAHYQFTPKVALTGRVEQFEDIPGVGGVGLRTGNAGYTKINSATLTLEYQAFRGHLVSRLEYRHDHSNQAMFGAGTRAVADQDTIYFGQVYKF